MVNQIMKIPSNDLSRTFKMHQEEYEQAALKVLRNGRYILGDEVAAFEGEFAEYIGAKYCVGLACGLDTLWIAFRLLGIGAQDEVIVASNAYIACVMGISINGAVPVFVEPDDYGNIDTDKLELSITPATKAILAVHLYGNPCNMDVLCDIAKRYKLLVVEDCSQSHGARWKTQRVGTFGNVGCFSFYPTKGCGAYGDAGAIVTNDDALFEDFRVFRNYGSRNQYEHEVIGTNSRLDEIQAALLRVKLRHLDELNQERQGLAAQYSAMIKSNTMQLPNVQKDADCTWHQYVIRTSYREQLINYLSIHQVGSQIHYPLPPHLSKAYTYLGYGHGSFPIAEKLADEVLSIPIYNGLTIDEQSYIIDLLNSFRP